MMPDQQTNSPIKVLIADDQSALRTALRMVLNQPGFNVVGEASNGQESLEWVARTLPDVVLMDLQMPVMGGIESTRLIHSTYPQVRIIILTSFGDDASIFGALQAGAVGYLLKNYFSAEDLAETIQATARGESILNPSVAARVVAKFSHLAHQKYGQPLANVPLTERQLDNNPQELDQTLTKREQEVLELLAHGLSNLQVGLSLSLSLSTIKGHVSHILEKLGLGNRAQLICWANQQAKK